MCFWLWFAFSQLLFVLKAPLSESVRSAKANRVQFHSAGPKSCFHPSACVALSDCTVFQERARHSTPKNAEFLKSKSCGFCSSTPLVCCPVVNLDSDKVVCGEEGSASSRVMGGAIRIWPIGRGLWQFSSTTTTKITITKTTTETTTETTTKTTLPT